MNEDMIASLYDSLRLSEKGVNIEKFSSDISDNAQMQQSVYDKLNLKDKGVDFSNFQQDLGATLQDTSPPPPLNKSEDAIDQAAEKGYFIEMWDYVAGSWNAGAESGKQGQILEVADFSTGVKTFQDLEDSEFEALSNSLKEQDVQQQRAQGSPEEGVLDAAPGFGNLLISSIVGSFGGIAQNLDEVGASAATGAAAGSFIPGAGTLTGAGYGMTAGMISAGVDIEFASILLGRAKKEAQQRGLDVTNPKDLKTILQDKDWSKQALSDATLGAGIIGAVDLATMGVVSKSGLTGGIARGFRASAVESPGRMIASASFLEGIGGAAGELGKQLAIEDSVNLQEVALEGFAGVVVDGLTEGLPALAASGKLQVKESRDRKSAEKAKVTMVQAAMDVTGDNQKQKIEEFAQGVDVMVTAGKLTPETAESLVGDFEEMTNVATSIPDDMLPSGTAKKEVLMSLVDSKVIDAQIVAEEQVLQTIPEPLKQRQVKKIEKLQKQKEKVDTFVNELVDGGDNLELQDYRKKNDLFTRIESGIHRADLTVLGEKVRVNTSELTDSQTQSIKAEAEQLGLEFLPYTNTKKIKKGKTKIEPNTNFVPQKNPTAENTPKLGQSKTDPDRGKDSSGYTSNDETFNGILSITKEELADLNNDPETIKVDSEKKLSQGDNKFIDLEGVKKVISDKVNSGKQITPREATIVKKFDLKFETIKNDTELNIADSNISDVGPDGISTKEFVKDKSKAIQETFDPDAGATIDETTVETSKVPNKDLEVQQKEFDVKKKEFEDSKSKIEAEEQAKVDKTLEDFDNASKSTERVNLGEVKVGDILTSTASNRRFKVTAVTKRRKKGKKGQKGKEVTSFSRVEIDVDGNPIKNRFSETDVSSDTRTSGGAPPITLNDFDNILVNGKQVDLKNSTLKDRATFVKELDTVRKKAVADRLKAVVEPKPPKATTTVKTEVTRKVKSTKTADRTADIFDQVAKTFSKRLGITPDAFWNKVLEKVVKTDKKTILEADAELVKLQNDEGGPRGAVLGTFKGKKILAALESPNKSTAIHELAHIFEDFLDVIEPNARQKVLKDYNDFTGKSLKDWNKDVSEFFAKSWEQYFNEPKKVQNAHPLKKAFDAFTDWMKDIYNGVIKFDNKDLTISDDLRQIFDKLVGTTEVKGPTKIKTVKEPVISTPTITVSKKAESDVAKVAQVDIDKALEVSKRIANDPDFQATKESINNTMTDLGVDLKSWTTVKLRDVFDRAIKLGHHNVQQALNNAAIYIDKVNGLDPKVDDFPALPSSQWVGMAIAMKQAERKLKQFRLFDKKIDTRKLTASDKFKPLNLYPQYSEIMYKDGNWVGVEPDQSFTPLPDQAKVSKEYRASLKAEMARKMSDIDVMMTMMGNAATLSNSQAGFALRLRGMVFPGGSPLFSKFKAKLEKSLGVVSLTKNQVDELKKALGDIDVKVSEQKRLEGAMNDLVIKARKDGANSALKKKNLNLPKATAKSKSNFKAVWTTLNKPTKVKFQEDNPITEADLIKAAQEVFAKIVKEKNPKNITELFSEFKKEFPDLDVSDEFLLDALVPTIKGSDSNAKKEVASRMAKIKAEGKLLRKVEDFVTGTVKRAQETGKVPKKAEIKKLENFLQDLRELAYNRNDLTPEQIGDALASLENMKILYDTLLFKDKAYASFSTSDLGGILDQVADSLKGEQLTKDKQAVSKLYKELGDALDAQMTQGPLSQDSRVRRKVANLKKVLNQLSDTDEIATPQQLNQVKRMLNDIAGTFPDTRREFSDADFRDILAKLKTSKDEKTANAVFDDIEKWVSKEFTPKTEKKVPKVKRLKKDVGVKLRQLGRLKEGDPLIDDVKAELEDLLQELNKYTSTEFDIKEVLSDRLLDNLRNYETSITEQRTKNAKPKLSPTERLSNSTKTRLRNMKDQLAEIEQESKILDGNDAAAKLAVIAKYGVKPKKSELTNELVELNQEINEIKIKFEMFKDKLHEEKHGKFYRRLGEINDTYRNSVLSFDLSAMGIQAYLLLSTSFSNMLVDLKRNGVDSFRKPGVGTETISAGVAAAFWGKDVQGNNMKAAAYYAQRMLAIKTDPVFLISQNLDIKLELNGLDFDSSRSEEFSNSLIDKIPDSSMFSFIKAAKDRSEQTFNATLNVARFESFKRAYEANPMATRQELNEMVEFINTSSGAISKLNGKDIVAATRSASGVFTAPRLYASTIKNTIGLFNIFAGLEAATGRKISMDGLFARNFEKLSPSEKFLAKWKTKQVIKQWGGITANWALYATVTAIANAIGGGDPEEVELLSGTGIDALNGKDDKLNFVSGSFGSVRAGEFSLNPNYLVPYVRFLGRIIGKTAIGETQVNIQDKENQFYGTRDGYDLFSDFLKYKLTPPISFMVGILTEDTVVGEPLTVKTDNAVVPNKRAILESVGSLSVNAFPLPISVRELGKSTIGGLYKYQQDSRTGREGHLVTDMTSNLLATFSNVFGISGNFYDNAAKSVYVEKVFKELDRSVGRTLGATPRDNKTDGPFPQILKKFDLNGDRNALGVFLSNQVQDDIGEFLMEMQDSGELSLEKIQRMAKERPKRMETFIKEINKMNKSVTKYRAGDFKYKYELESVPKKWTSKKVKWENHRNKLKSLLTF